MNAVLYVMSFTAVLVLLVSATVAIAWLLRRILRAVARMILAITR